MSLESPLGRVRGLGTAKEGTGHFWHQRLTAIALVPLTFLFVIVMFAFFGADHARAVELMGNPLVATVMLLFLLTGFYHMKLGMQVVIEDNISHGGVKIAALLCVTFGGFTLATASLFAVLKLALGGCRDGERLSNRRTFP